jgi:hypothetical protein
MQRCGQIAMTKTYLDELAPGTALAVLRKLPAPRNKWSESDGCRFPVHHDPGQNAFLAAAITQLASARLMPGGFAPDTSNSTLISSLPAANSRQAI